MMFLTVVVLGAIVFLALSAGLLGLIAAQYDDGGDKK